MGFMNMCASIWSKKLMVQIREAWSVIIYHNLLFISFYLAGVSQTTGTVENCGDEVLWDEVKIHELLFSLLIWLQLFSFGEIIWELSEFKTLKSVADHPLCSSENIDN